MGSPRIPNKRGRKSTTGADGSGEVFRDAVDPQSAWNVAFHVAQNDGCKNLGTSRNWENPQPLHRGGEVASNADLKVEKTDRGVKSIKRFGVAEKETPLGRSRGAEREAIKRSQGTGR